jgi:hypothetical protein
VVQSVHHNEKAFAIKSEYLVIGYRTAITGFSNLFIPKSEVAWFSRNHPFPTDRLPLAKLKSPDDICGAL